LPTAAAALVGGLLVASVPAAAWLLPLCLALAALRPEGRGPGLALALGLLAGWARDREAEAEPAWAEGQACVTPLAGEVLEAEPAVGGRLRFVLQASVAGEGPHARAFDARVEIRVEGAYDLELHPGDRLRLVARLEAPGGPLNPGEADRRGWTRRRGIDLVGWIEAPEALEVNRRSSSLAAELHALRAGAASALSARLDGADAGLARALLLGDRGALNDEDARLFRDAGQSHVVAVSGQHVTLVLAAVLLLARALGLARGPAAALGLVAVLLYVPLAGAAPSAVRSGLGSSLWLLARLLARRGQALTLVAGVALGMLAVKPEDLGDPGFTLSFAAVLGIELLAPRLLEAMARPAPRIPGLLEPRRPRLRAALAVALAAWLAGAPIALHVFGQLAPAAAPWALLAVPLATLLLGLSALLLLLGACRLPRRSSAGSSRPPPTPCARCSGGRPSSGWAPSTARLPATSGWRRRWPRRSWRPWARGACCVGPCWRRRVCCSPRWPPAQGPRRPGRACWCSTWAALRARC
jgi:competence protein ComEC